MKLLRPIRGGSAPLSFLRRRLRLRTKRSHRKRASGFENAEPSSPKVTCIGQVRGKSKKKVKQYRRRISFRNTEQYSNSSVHYQRDQRWVHLPVSVCEALRKFRAEILSLFLCKCCCVSKRTKEIKAQKRGCCNRNGNGCWGVFVRWVNCGGGRKVVVGGGETVSVQSSRRHVFDDFEVEDEKIDEDEAARMSICIPPKNALLLMRCRSDPMKVAALVNRFSLDVAKYEDIQEESDDELFETKHDIFENPSEESEGELIIHCQEQENHELEAKNETLTEEVTKEDESILVLEENTVDCKNCPNKENPVCHLSAESGEEVAEESTNSDKDTTNDEQCHDTAQKEPDPADQQDEVKEPENQELVIDNNQETQENNEIPLPECLLLMMREPKLSMEVSKETWVGGADFIRLLPQRPRKAATSAVTGGCRHEPAVKRRPSIDQQPPRSSKPRVPVPPPSKRNEQQQQQPPRASCSMVAASMATTCEPFVLTRCKSEPMSTAAAKLMPESCNVSMKLEPHRQAALGVGAAGVGF